MCRIWLRPTFESCRRVQQCTSGCRQQGAEQGVSTAPGPGQLRRLPREAARKISDKRARGSGSERTYTESHTYGGAVHVANATVPLPHGDSAQRVGPKTREFLDKRGRRSRPFAFTHAPCKTTVVSTPLICAQHRRRLLDLRTPFFYALGTDSGEAIDEGGLTSGRRRQKWRREREGEPVGK